MAALRSQSYLFKIPNAKRKFQQEEKHFLRTLGKRTKEEASEVFCVECSVAWFRDLDTTTE